MSPMEARGAHRFGRMRRYSVRALGVVSLGTAALVVGPLATNHAGAVATTVTLNPGSLTVPSDNVYQGSLTVTINNGTPSSVDNVTVTESDAGTGKAGCPATLDASGHGTCNILTNHLGAATTATISATETGTGAVSPNSTIHFTALGPAPTGVSLSVTNGFAGAPSPAPPATTDAFSDGNHYLLSEPTLQSAQYNGTPSEAIVTATMMNGGVPLSAGDLPFAINWTITNADPTNILYLDAVSNVVSLAGSPPVANVICSQGSTPPALGGHDNNTSPNCTPGSFDLDTPGVMHFSNPGVVGQQTNDLGTANGTFPPAGTAGTQTLLAGHTFHFTTYTTGAINNAFVVLDSKSNKPAQARVSAQVFNDPYAVPGGEKGSAIGSSSALSPLLWLPPVATGANVTGAVVASDATEPAEPDNGNDWAVINVNGVLQLINFDEAAGQTYAAGGGAVNEATFETDLANIAGFPGYTVANYGKPGQANTLNGPPAPVEPTPTWGYWTVASDGGIFSFGDAKFHGSMGGTHLNQPMVGMSATSTGQGYWTVASDGGIFSFGDAGFFGSMGGTHLNQPMVGMASTGDDKGYWTVASDGGIFSFGDAKFFGSMGGTKLNKPVVGMAATPDSQGYWLVASDGGIFSFGDAKFFGSTGNIALNKPVVGMDTTADGAGYWLVASDGGIFAFGNAAFFGSMGGTHINQPMVGMTATPDGLGYWTVASDGGIFSFGDAKFFGSMGGIKLNQPMVGMAETQI